MARTHGTIRPMEKPEGRPGGGRRWKWYLIAVIIAVIVLAWVDGGEEPLHPIVQEIDVPEAQ